ncbi:hypothetical protein C8R41DRAFT_870651 [Lentinula lateritia]|uniref:P-loop containing nucleoside triphosphate hydrolase protein n=1 Tax=Lentinula lateritia TaxID=40482 RepID=A0ABQ8V739_9AGAR|nr:hypothetical protein C8R41DRAFT_870651 [Lentinula lateritia]
MDTIRSLVQPLVGPSTASSAGMIDGMKLVVLGGTVATARKMGSRAWNHFVNSFFLTAHFSEDDYPYDWLMLWLSRRPEWQRSREFETTTRLATPLSGGSNSSSSRTADNSFGDEDYREWWAEDPAEEQPQVYSYDGDDVPGKVKTRVVFQPTFDTTHTIYYRGHWLRVRRSRKGDNMGNNGGWGGSYGYSSGGGGEILSVSVVARSNTILKQLVLQAKREYEAEAIHRIQIYFADSHGGWRWTDSRHKRPMSSIVLNPGYKEMLLSDTKDFLNSEKWYADRGIPFRRGYLLHGVPGSGKSSLIHAIVRLLSAGELMLDIYALSLSAAWINDATLTTLMGRVPARCIVLLEDLDAAFTRSTGRRSKKDKKRKDKKDKKDKKSKDKSKSDSNNNGSGTTVGINSGSSSRRRRTGTSGINGGANTTDALSEVNTLSLSGLLNALDGVAAAEGRLLFATTNHLDHLDPALSRPGRMDVWIDFKNASKWQAEALFRNFFPSCEEDSSSGDQEKKASRASTPTPASPSSSLPSPRSSFSSPSSSYRQSRASSTSPAEPTDDGTITLDPGSLPPSAPELSAEEEAEFAAMGLVLPDVPRSASTPEGDISNLGAEESGPSSRPSTASSGVGSWVGMPTGLSSSMANSPKVTEVSTRHTAASNGTWSPSPSLSSLSSIGSAVWSMPTFMSSTASLVTGAVGAVTGSSPRSPAASSPSLPRSTSSTSPQRQPQSKTPRQHTHSPAPLSPSVLSKLAQEFAQKVPDEEFSVAALQGYLLRNKSRPEEAVKGVEAWVEEERRNKEKQKGGKGKGKGSEEERKKRREQRKERREKKKKSSAQSNPVSPAVAGNTNQPSDSPSAPPTDSMILMPLTQSDLVSAPPVVLSPTIMAQPLPVIPIQKTLPPEPEASTKKTKSKSKSKSRKSKSASKSDDNDGSDSDSSSSSSSDSESSSNSDSDSDSSSDSSSDDDDENTDPRPRQSTTSMARSPPSPPIPSYDWSVEPAAWEATPANGGWGKGW